MPLRWTIWILAALSLSHLWWTPDQQGQRLLDREDYAAAAEQFADPMRTGVAWFRAKEFARAEQAFARASGPDAAYNRGTCLIMLGKYEAAVKTLDVALNTRPDWEDAQINREVAATRMERTKAEGGDMGDQQIGADEIVFDKKGKQGGQETELDGDEASTSSAMQALWLRRVQTRPADFLKAKFAYQLAVEEEGSP